MKSVIPKINPQQKKKYTSHYIHKRHKIKYVEMSIDSWYGIDGMYKLVF